MTRPILNRGNIQLRKLVTVNKSLGITIPRRFVEKMQLNQGEYMQLELNKDCNSIVLGKLNVG